jgi:hypothetical protein
MKETINEHDMTKKMMRIMRGGPINEIMAPDSEQQQVGSYDQNQDVPPPVQSSSNKVKDGREPMIALNGSYFE